MPPNSASGWAAISLADSGSDTSTRTASALPPSRLDAVGDPLAPSVLMSATTTAAPRGKRLGVGLADTAAGAGDDRDLLVELPQAVPFSCW